MKRLAVFALAALAVAAAAPDETYKVQVTVSGMS